MVCCRRFTASSGGGGGRLRSRPIARRSSTHSDQARLQAGRGHRSRGSSRKIAVLETLSAPRSRGIGGNDGQPIQRKRTVRLGLKWDGYCSAVTSSKGVDEATACRSASLNGRSCCIGTDQDHAHYPTHEAIFKLNCQRFNLGRSLRPNRVVLCRSSYGRQHNRVAAPSCPSLPRRDMATGRSA